ncbi:unnamed protein product [Linum trigynum]|uniref:Uncharacterized protein n=1 Tax=Linum trigynum TaxID=586398 RepID=A0AAV2G6G6_9ROSI
MNGNTTVLLVHVNEVCGYYGTLLGGTWGRGGRIGEEAGERDGLRRERLSRAVRGFREMAGPDVDGRVQGKADESGRDRVDASEAELGGATTTVMSLSNWLQQRIGGEKD